MSHLSAMMEAAWQKRGKERRPRAADKATSIMKAIKSRFLEWGISAEHIPPRIRLLPPNHDF